MSHMARVLVIDDTFGRVISGRYNQDRANLCGQFLLDDVTGDHRVGSPVKVKKPVAEAVFFRGQTPPCAGVGDVVENDLSGVVGAVERGWGSDAPLDKRWALVLVDLCFYTGLVTPESNRRSEGMPAGRQEDSRADSFFGLRILSALHGKWPELPVVIFSSKPREESSRRFSELGASAFLSRDEADAPGQIREYIWRYGLVPDETGILVGQSAALLTALRAARRAARERRNVLIRGERGAGKELLARYINRVGQPPERPLVVVDSGTLTPQLYASELFGHSRGAYTGADRQRVGRILQANGGDLFLDEIGNMTADVQAGLLRVIEQRTVSPVGENDSTAVDVRFLSATNEQIETPSAERPFRPDLLDRLREGGVIPIPPLRERRDDIPMLVESFLREAERSIPQARRRTVAPDAMTALCAYDWPGNVRELRSYIFSAVSSHADIEFLVLLHLPSLFEGRRISTPVKDSHASAKTTDSAPPSTEAVESLRKAVQGVDFDPLRPHSWTGCLRDLRTLWGDLQLKLLRASIQATRRTSVACLDGKILIHPAVKLMTGDAHISASRAADVVKKIFAGLTDEVLAQALKDPVLVEVHEIALRLRPRGGVRKDPRTARGHK